MIRENQKLFNKLNIVIDSILIFVSMMLAYWIRFGFFRASLHKLEFEYYVVAVLCLIPIQLVVYKTMGLYEAFRKKTIVHELGRLFSANSLGLGLLLMALFILKKEDFSRGTLLAFFWLEFGSLGAKRVTIRLILRYMRKSGYNLKYVLLVGGGEVARQLEREIQQSPQLGYAVQGVVSDSVEGMEADWLGGFDVIYDVLEKYKPDEVFAALDVEEYSNLPLIIRACEASGTRFSLVPCYAKYIPIRPHVDSLNGIPMLNLRRIPLDNMANAFVKRLVDIIGSLLLIILSSPIMIFAAIGVKLSSPGPILFKQVRVGRNKKPFKMYKFRSMRVNDSETTGWSTNSDPRRTHFGSFIRKYSIDELPQFFNVLFGDMSLVGPRPELPHFVEHFREEIPLYMVKHQVRPGITGWAQVHGFRGDTSIAARIKHDVFYIENWSLLLDIQILFMTLKHISNEEELV